MSETHIKMPDVVPVVRYAGDGVRTSFPFSFPVFASEDVAVYIDGGLQASGYTVADAGASTGGQVDFILPPASGATIAIERRVPLERMTDFVEGGTFSSRALNNELDYLTAALQQVARDQRDMLRFDGRLEDTDATLPPRATRAGRALGFDDAGNLTSVPYGLTQASPSIVQSGAGAVTRSVAGKLGESISVRDFGAIGNGVADDTTAFQNALAAHAAVFVPSGTYRLTATLVLGQGQRLHGQGASSILAADGHGFNVIEMRQGYSCVEKLKTSGGAVGIKLYGQAGPCVQNLLRDVVIDSANYGIVLDGYASTANPCYWNAVEHVLVLSPSVCGVHLTKTGAGDTPNANRFCGVRVYSLGAAISGSGINIEYGANANTFTDCEVNVSGTATACVRVGAQAQVTQFINLFCETSGTVDNIRLEAGSQDTSIVNLLAMSGGAAIHDLSGGKYIALNAGYPDKSTFTRARLRDATVLLLRHDALYVDATGPATLDINTANSVHLVAATNGAITMRLPAASAVNGSVFTIKKVDYSDNMVTVVAASGSGPDGRNVYLGGPGDYVCVMSNGAGWYVLSSNRMAGNTRYHDGAGTYDVDLSVDTYLLSAYAGAKTARLPPANAAAALNRTVTIKKTDVSTNAVTVNVQGGGLIDGGTSVVLSAQYQCLTAVSNGAQWYLINRYP